jgi:selenocysteine lyase/cysteine desulfurase
MAGFKDMKHVTVYGMEEDLSSRACLVGFNLEGIESTKGCELYREKQIRLHAPGQDPFFAAMLKQLGISSFIRLSACHYNTQEEIELFLKATESFA